MPWIPNVETLLASVVMRPSGCWEWTGYKSKDGYGKRGGLLAHRLIYRLLVGPIPEGLSIDHLCRKRDCCNPQHLEPVPLIENWRRGVLARTSCRRGHPYDDANTYWYSGKRHCRNCIAMNKISRRIKEEQG